MKDLSDFIYVKENVYSGCGELIEYVESLDSWQKSLVRSNDADPARKSDQFYLHPKSVKNPYARATIKAKQKEIRGIFIKHLREYLEPYKRYCEVSQEEAFFILRYGVGGEYKAHSDGDTGKLNRRVTGLIYLNEEYEGGEISFPYADVTIKPKTGTLVLFPSNFLYPHASLPIVSGTKYTLVSWFR